MCGIGFVKRFLPFVATLVVGLFIASFFVSLATPNFEGFGRGPGRMREYRRVKMENEDLRRENCRLKSELEAARSEKREFTVDTLPPDINNAVPPPPLPRQKEIRVKVETR